MASASSTFPALWISSDPAEHTIASKEDRVGRKRSFGKGGREGRRKGRGEGQREKRERERTEEERTEVRKRKKEGRKEKGREKVGKNEEKERNTLRRDGNEMA
eukprot:1660802-Pleurochrysis_carterae.AAC.1